MKKKSRAEMTGMVLGFALVKVVDLMYQLNTAKNFLFGLICVLQRFSKKLERKRGKS